jgi:hypothetical protein
MTLSRASSELANEGSHVQIEIDRRHEPAENLADVACATVIARDYVRKFFRHTLP